MKTLTVLCNIVLFGFTCFVLVTDGTPKEASYIVFTLLVVLIPILNVVVLFRSRADDGWVGPHMKEKALETQPKTDAISSRSTAIERVAVICNIILLGFACWAFVDQYPHPKEDGVIAYALIVVLAPILNVVVFFSSWRSDSRLGPQTKSTADQEQREINEVSQSSNRY